MSTGIYKRLSDIEKFVDGGGNLTTAVNMWNELVKGSGNPNALYGGKSIIENVMINTTYTYKYTYSILDRDGKTTKKDFQLLQWYTGFGLSRQRLKDIATYLNLKYNTNVFTMPDWGLHHIDIYFCIRRLVFYINLILSNYNKQLIEKFLCCGLMSY
ncbi:MAG: hypothetical protein LBT09_15965 [Planctomycetaceae bacterium]|jgi:hypothetical protein|nr:hypothetical protein [Planctomycetaceae bacterium]